MKPTILLIDANYLCHRAFHTTGSLTYEDVGTGVAFGVFREFIALQELFTPIITAWCFDSKHSHRVKLYPGYKETRRRRYANATPEERAGIDEFRNQVTHLRQKLLPSVGFSNVFCYKGFEADDIIASLANNAATDRTSVVIASSDQDLLQCLRPGVIFHSPSSRKTITHLNLHTTFGVDSKQWAEVKAWAGCKTDDVPGVPGVAEVTAAKYLRCELKSGKKLEAITANLITFIQNLPLVTLPFPGTPVLELQPDKLTSKKWQATMHSLGMSSIEGFAPMGMQGSPMPRGVRSK